MRDRIEAGSLAAEQMLEFIDYADSLIDRGNDDEARKIVQAAYAVAHIVEPNLFDLRDLFAGVSNGQIQSRNSYGASSYFGSAHEAAAHVAGCLLVGARGDAWPMPPNVGEWLGVNPRWLIAALRVERAKLLDKYPAAPQIAEKPAATLRQNEVAAVLAMWPAEVQRKVDSGELTAITEGRAKFITDESLLRYLKATADSLKSLKKKKDD